MTLNLKTPRVETDFKPRITVIGVGGAGGNAVNNMIRANLEGVEFLVCNTDAQAMGHTLSERRMQLGAELTQGLGAGSRPDIGRAAAEESLDELMQLMAGNNLVFITAGMGGGTGTGAAPVIARACREAGMLTVGVVTKPFMFEGRQRMQLAGEGIAELQQYVDTLIVIPNQNLFRVANEKTTFADAFKMADDVLFAGVRSITDLMVVPGLINLDFADIRSVMAEMGKAMMGTGEAEGDRRAIEAAEAAIANPLLEDLSIKSAEGLLINITGGQDMTLMEVDEAVNRILEEVDPDADMIFGSTFDDSLQGKIRISVVATGIDPSEIRQPRSTPYAVAAPAPGSARVPVLAAVDGATAESPATLGDGPDIQADFDDEAPADMIALMGHDPDRGDGEPDALSAQQHEDAFIPPAAVEREDMGAAEPFAAAAMENGGPEKSRKKKKRSLFERMASVATGSSEDRSPRQAELQRVEPTATPAPPRPEPVRPEKLETIESPARPDPADTDSDMLDIPAFLRRQAN